MITSSYSDRDIQFLSESNKLEGLSEIQYEKNLPPEGYLGAYLMVKHEAALKVPLSTKKIEQWYCLIQENDKTAADINQSLTSVIENINDRLESLRQNKESSEIVSAIGQSLYEVEKTKPFKKDNGRIARLIANYIAKFCRIPPLVFNSSEKESYLSAIEKDNASDFIQMIKSKIREVVYDQMGNEYFLKEDFGNSASYYCPDNNKTIIKEWHDLNKLKDQ